jgi:hypothetical protein
MTVWRRHRWLPALAVGCAIVAARPVAATSARVFYSPAERAAIEATRRARWEAGRSPTARLAGGSPPDAGNADSTRSTTSADGPAASGGRGRLDGVAVAAGTRAAAWIDGRRLVDGGRFGAYRLRVASNGVRLIASDGRERFVRVGDEVAP